MTTVDKPLIQQAWLRAILYILFSFVLVYVASGLVDRLFSGLEPDPGAEGISIKKMLISYTPVAVILPTLAFLFKHYADKQPIFSMGFQWKGYRKHAASGFFLGILLLCTGSLILVLLQFLFFTGTEFNITDLLLSVLFFMIVAMAEEIAFRAYILNNLMQSTNKWMALFISSALFSLFHAANANVSVIALLNIFVAGFLLGINYVFTRNIWFAVFLHFSWNFFQGPVLGFEVSGMNISGLLQQTLKGPDLVTGGSFGFEGSLVCLSLNILCTIMLASYYAGYRTRPLPEFKH